MMNSEESWFSGNVLKHPLSVKLRPWLLNTGSFMSRLKEFGIIDAEIQVIQQQWLIPEVGEALALAMSPGSEAFIREVIIKNSRYEWMFARTVLPSATLTENEAELAQLEDRALGTILFKDNRWHRKEFEFAYLDRQSCWFKKLLCHTQLNADSVWARRSQFHLNEKKLLLTEIFLPDIEKLS